MPHPARVIERFEYRTDHGRTGTCHLEIIPLVDGRRTAVIATERADNPGQSVTNAAEHVATAACERFGIDPATLVWIEHYGHPVSFTRVNVNEYDRVTFGLVAPDRRPMFDDPDWRRMSKSDWEQLGLEPRH